MSQALLNRIKELEAKVASVAELCHKLLSDADLRIKALEAKKTKNV
jgi:hypothetical protein